MDKTLKVRVFADPGKGDAAPGNRSKEHNASLELAKINAQLQEEKQKVLELLKTVVQLRENLKLEQNKSAELQAKLNKVALAEDNQIAKKNAQLEEEKKKSLEYLRTIEQLKESIKKDQTKKSQMVNIPSELEDKTRKLAALETKVQELSGVLGMISRIAAVGKQE